MKVLIAMDKFKGSMTAAEAAGAVSAGIAGWGREVDVTVSSIADGGEGTAEILQTALGGDRVFCGARDALGKQVEAWFGYVSERKLALVEMAAASGLEVLLDRGATLDPWNASTAGTGDLILEAGRRGARKIILGIGGSATNDGGAGMAQALGFEFLDSEGKPIDEIPARLHEVARITRPQGSHPEIVVASDVTNPLLGNQGCSRVYGPQKGVEEGAMDGHEARLMRLADVVAESLGVDYRDEPGAGAAGGLGFGLLSFCGASLEPGFPLVAEITDLGCKVEEADLVITGEGSLDEQSLNGKGPVGVAELARMRGKPVLAFAGRVAGRTALSEIFDGLVALSSTQAEAEDSMREGPRFLAEAVRCSQDLLPGIGVK